MKRCCCCWGGVDREWRSRGKRPNGFPFQSGGSEAGQRKKKKDVTKRKRRRRRDEKRRNPKKKGECDYIRWSSIHHPFRLDMHLLVIALCFAAVENRRWPQSFSTERSKWANGNWSQIRCYASAICSSRCSVSLEYSIRNR